MIMAKVSHIVRAHSQSSLESTSMSQGVAGCNVARHSVTGCNKGGGVKCAMNITS